MGDALHPKWQEIQAVILKAYALSEESNAVRADIESLNERIFPSVLMRRDKETIDQLNEIMEHVTELTSETATIMADINEQIDIGQ